VQLAFVYPSRSGLSPLPFLALSLGELAFASVVVDLVLAYNDIVGLFRGCH